jgi:hypothetical protein
MISHRLSVMRRKASYYATRVVVTSIIFSLGVLAVAIGDWQGLKRESQTLFEHQSGHDLEKTALVLAFLLLAVIPISLTPRPSHQPAAKTVFFASVSFALVSALDFGFHAASVLTGLFGLGLGCLIKYGNDLRHRILEPQWHFTTIMPPPAFSFLIDNRNREFLGSILIVLGMALIGSTFVHWWVGLAFLSILTSGLLLREVDIRRSGQTKRMADPWWSFSTSIGLVACFVFLALIGFTIERHVRLLDTEQSSQTPMVLQALLGAQGGVAALAVAVLALVVQLRATSFGADLALRLQDWRGLILVGLTAIAAISLTTLVLGNWNHWGSESSFADLSLLFAAGSMTLIAFSVGRLAVAFANSRSIIEPIATLALSPKLEDKLMRYGWNPGSTRFIPDSVHFFTMALIGAWKLGDMELFTDLVERWQWNIKRQPFLSPMEFMPAGAYQERRELQVKKERLLPWRSAHALDGLDIALQRAARSVGAAIKYEEDYVVKLARLCDLIYPPFYEEGKGRLVYHHWDEPIPGFRLLDEMINIFAQLNNWSGVEWVLRWSWSERAILAISWAEQLTDEDEINGRAPTLTVANDLIDSITKIGREAREDNPELYKAVIDVLLDVGKEITSRAALLHVMMALTELEAFKSDIYYWKIRDFTSVVAKQHAPMNWSLSLAKEISQLPRRTYGAYPQLEETLNLLSTLVSKISEPDPTNDWSNPFDILRQIDVVDLAWSVVQRELEFKDDDNPFQIFNQTGLIEEFSATLTEPVRKALEARLQFWVAEDSEARARFASLLQGRTKTDVPEVAPDKEGSKDRGDDVKDVAQVDSLAKEPPIASP